jgi:hypothetical protein
MDIRETSSVFFTYILIISHYTALRASCMQAFEKLLDDPDDKTRDRHSILLTIQLEQAALEAQRDQEFFEGFENPPSAVEDDNKTEDDPDPRLQG